MSQFHLPFDPALTSLSSPDAHVTVVQLPFAEQVKSYDAEAHSTLVDIANKLAAIERSVLRQFDQLQQQIVTAAVMVATSALGEQHELIEMRAENFVRTALETLKPQVPKTVLVHPQCVAAIQRWITASEHSGIEVQADEAVLPGDCRIEADSGGVAATLEAFLAAVTDQLSTNGAIG